ncbi:MAG: dienelactone hydrolase family protein [Chitinophagaceae bacterium]|nr:dienelactone hydrolase family protein [Chitinophagaceae bacterium]
MHQKHVMVKGKKLGEADKVLIMIHGRGASAESILSLADYLNVNDYTLLAPEATGNTWYPYSFLAPPFNNEPWLSSALDILGEILEDVNNSGIRSDNTYFLGFSQGACLTLEFVARNAQRFGGVAAFTGGLIGDRVYEDNYAGDFGMTPVFIGSSDPDAHIPVARVHETTTILKKLNANVTEKIYPNMGHTVSEDEIEIVNSTIFTV